MIWDLAEILARKRRAPELDVLALRTPPRPVGPARRRGIPPELVAGNGGGHTTPSSRRFTSTGRFTASSDPQSFPMP